MGVVSYNDLRRAQQVDAKKTQDLGVRRVLGAYGTRHLVVRESEICGDERIVPNVSGQTFGPNAQSLVGTIGGGNSRVVISRPPSGHGSTLTPRQVSKTVPVTKKPPVGYLAFYKDDTTHLTVKSMDTEGDVVETLIDNQAVPAGTIDTDRSCLSLITGDGNLPDNSFTLATTSAVYAVNISTGDFTALYTPSGEILFWRGAHYDTGNNKVYIASYVGISVQDGKLREVATDGSGLTVVQTHSTPGPGGYVDGNCVWSSDRAILFAETAIMDGCTEFPYAGGGAVARGGGGAGAGDLPLDTAVSLVTADLFPAGSDRRMVDLDAGQTYFTAGQMPLTTGNAVSSGWPTATFYPGQGGTAYASMFGNNLVLWPVLKAPAASEHYILKWDVTAGAPTVDDNLIEVTSVTTGPVSPFAIIAIA